MRQVFKEIIFYRPKRLSHKIEPCYFYILNVQFYDYYIK